MKKLIMLGCFIALVTNFSALAADGFNIICEVIDRPRNGAPKAANPQKLNTRWQCKAEYKSDYKRHACFSGHYPYLMSAVEQAQTLCSAYGGNIRTNCWLTD